MTKPGHKIFIVPHFIFFLLASQLNNTLIISYWKNEWIAISIFQIFSFWCPCYIGIASKYASLVWFYNSESLALVITFLMKDICFKPILCAHENQFYLFELQLFRKKMNNLINFNIFILHYFWKYLNVMVIG